MALGDEESYRAIMSGDGNMCGYNGLPLISVGLALGLAAATAVT